ncbi:uncharacterized protein VTP21DRAFT_3975 [Calcarisporiella thermophila]|uniref:uncharacterized protein n=1 Tax=Calcarisporiella thermophila TaxID=911321 RepID=UPI0037429F3A
MNGTNGLVGDPAISEAYEEVRSDKTETNWLLLEFAPTKPDRLIVAGTGTGGLKELVTKLRDDQAAFGYVRMNFANDEYSQRVKFVLINWCGQSVGVMRKAKLSIQTSEVKHVLRSFHIEVPASHAEDLDEKDIMLHLKRCAGANYDAQQNH